MKCLSALNDMEPPDKGEGKCIEERRGKKNLKEFSGNSGIRWTKSSEKK